MAGDVLLVTGGGRGIGASVVRRAAQAGIAVAFSYQSDETAALALVSEVESAGSGSSLACATCKRTDGQHLVDRLDARGTG